MLEREQKLSVVLLGGQRPGEVATRFGRCGEGLTMSLVYRGMCAGVPVSLLGVGVGSGERRKGEGVRCRGRAAASLPLREPRSRGAHVQSNWAWLYAPNWGFTWRAADE